jgi:hypothetical protein
MMILSVYLFNVVLGCVADAVIPPFCSGVGMWATVTEGR